MITYSLAELMVKLVNNAAVDALSTINRGNVINAELSINDSSINKFYCAGETDEDDINGTVDNVSFDIKGCNIESLSVGKNKGNIISTVDDAKSVISKLNIVDTTVNNYADNSEELLKDIITSVA